MGRTGKLLMVRRDTVARLQLLNLPEGHSHSAVRTGTNQAAIANRAVNTQRSRSAIRSTTMLLQRMKVAHKSFYGLQKNDDNLLYTSTKSTVSEEEVSASGDCRAGVAAFADSTNFFFVIWIR
jgi:hypothetical protein